MTPRTNEFAQPIGEELPGWSGAEWPAFERAFTRWLVTENFDAQGRQKRKLQELMAAERDVGLS